MKHWNVGKKHWVLPVTVVCLVLGALMALEFRTQAQIGLPGQRAEILAQMLAAERNQLELLQKEVSERRRDLQQMQEAATQRDEMLTLLNQQLEAGRMAMGLTKVQGPGIVMSLEDSTLRMESGVNAEPLLVHDYDLWPVVNELRAAGAEAISINGERVIGTTAIRCAGPVLQVNGVPVTSPFEIKAIGDPRTLAGALTIPNGVIDKFRQWQAPAKVERRDLVVIKAIGVAPRFRYAKSVVDTED